jgi:hypothetical protein
VNVAEVYDTERSAPTRLENLRIRRRGFGEVHGKRGNGLGNADAHKRVAEFFGRGARGVYLTKVLTQDRPRAGDDARTNVRRRALHEMSLSASSSTKE